MIVFSFLGCFFLGFFGFWIFHRIKSGGFEALGHAILEKAERESERKRDSLEFELKEKTFSHQRKLEELLQNARSKIAKEEERLTQREDKLEGRMVLIEKKWAEIEKKEGILVNQREKLEEEKKSLVQLQQKALEDLQHISGLTTADAKELLLKRVENQVSKDMACLTQRLKVATEEHADKEATRVLTTAINRLAISCTSDLAVMTISLPNEEIKGRIIGREGRNIRVLEQLTGVNFLVDDTPNAVVISGFDPIRKHVAKAALKELILDGRIHPTSIEEAVQKAQIQIEKKIKENGEDCALRAGVLNLHPELITLLGKLYFRTSYGQNILEHSLEVSHILGLMAGELGLDIALAKRIGLLHDMGKAVTHEMEGSHALVGYELALKFGEKEEVANGIGCHHNEMAPKTLEASLCSSADAISGSRPGARAEAVEQYIKRLKKLESISCEFEGVTKAYALQAGRELRVLVEPDLLDDSAIVNLARELAHRIEQEMSFPGKIKVTVIREKRATEYAT